MQKWFNIQRSFGEHSIYDSVSKVTIFTPLLLETGAHASKTNQKFLVSAGESGSIHGGTVDTSQHTEAAASKVGHRCGLCPYVSKSAAKLKRHLLTHSKERPFKCTHCWKTFARSDTLTDHLRLHSAEKPYRCTMCPYGAFNKKTLVRHWKVHADENNAGTS